MAELILPGVYVEVRAEALIVGGPITVGNVGIVGTASRGPVNVPKVLGSFADAKQIFGDFDAFSTPNALTLVRALELAYANGASTVFAVRVANTNRVQAAPDQTAMLGNATIFDLKAIDPGTWANGMTVTVEDAPNNKSKVTIKLSDAEQEEYVVESGTDLVEQIKLNSALVEAEVGDDKANKPAPVANVPFAGGTNGADAADDPHYKAGLAALTNQNAHIIVAAGQSDNVIGNELLEHVNNASTDEVRRDRIAVVGSRAKTAAQDASAFLAAAGTPFVSGERIVYVMPGIKVTDSAADPPREITLPGAYTAAAIAGMLSARSPHISLTNKAVAVGGLEAEFNSAQLKQLVQAGVLAVEKRRGFRVVKGITTDLGAFQQITTRRIVDFAKFGVRAAAEPYIGLLNNDRVRKALKGSINGFLADMVTDEMIVSYELDVTASRDDEIRGIARVTMTVRPTFSIDYIKVVMFLG